MLRKVFRSVPRPLVLLLAAVALLGGFWALLVPPWQVPDEYAHFAYTQSLAENGQRPNRADHDTYSTEHEQAIEISNAGQTSGIPFTQPEWSRSAQLEWEQFATKVTDRQRKDGGGPNPAVVNPPLYYLYAAGAYKAGGDLFDRLYIVRLASVLLLLLTVLGGWLLAGEIFSRDRTAQLVTAATCGMVPMVTYMNSSNNPDAMVYPIWTIALWLVARAVLRNGRPKDVVALAVVAGASVAVKAVSWALIPGVVLAVVLAYLPALRLERAVTIKRIAISLGVLAIGVIAWPVIDSMIKGSGAAGVAGSAGGLTVSTDEAFNFREFVGYMIQFYFPSPPFLAPFPLIEPLPVYDTFLKGAWGSFSWLEVDLPGQIYAALAAVTMAVGVGAIVTITRRWQAVDKRLLAVFASVVICLLAGLHLTEYKLVKSGVPFNQGRYILPLIGLAAIAVVCALRSLPARWQPRLAASWLVMLFGLQLLSLATVAIRFYA